VSGASVWDEGGTDRVLLHIAGGALIGGLGGGSVFTAVGGGLGAGLSSKLAGQLESLSKGVASETGSELLGNLAANVAAGAGGALVGGTAGAATGSAVELYNQMLHQKKKDMVSQICGAGAQCSDATLNAVIQAQGANAQASPINAIGPDYVTIGAGSMSGAVGGTMNVDDGTVYGSYSVSQSFRPSSFAPSGAVTAGWIFGASGANGVNDFLNGDGNQFAISIPTPLPVNAVVAVTHGYGGATALEVGVAPLGPPSISITPWSHSVPLNK
jgi:filamentous hemagglutinin